jgi:hypothetical protein
MTVSPGAFAALFFGRRPRDAPGRPASDLLYLSRPKRVIVVQGIVQEAFR